MELQLKRSRRERLGGRTHLIAGGSKAFKEKYDSYFEMIFLDMLGMEMFIDDHPLVYPVLGVLKDSYVWPKAIHWTWLVLDA